MVSLKLLHQTQSINVRPIKESLTCEFSSCVIYKYVCDCGANYIGKTNRNLGTRIKEHIPLALIQGRVENIANKTAVTEHLVANADCRNGSDPCRRFKIVLKSQHRTKLNILEAVAISRLKPSLTKQNDFVCNLKLPW